MSGGHFEYNQYKISDIAVEIEELILKNDSTEKDEWGQDKGAHYSPEIIERFIEAMMTLRKAQIMAHRIDWLVSGDDGPESFLRRWEEDLAKMAGAVI